MASCQEPLLKSDDEDELVFDRTGLLSNKITVKPDVCQRGHSSGKRMQYARTVNLCLAFFALGLCFAIPTATLNDLQATVGADLADIGFIYTARYSGYVFGSIIGGILFDRYNRQFLLFLSLLATAIGIITMPFCTKVGALMACTAITGITMGFLDTGGNVWCLDLWGKKSAPFMQTLHFCFGLGAFVAPLVAEPFLSPHFGNTTGLTDSSAVNGTLKNVPHIWFPHQRVKAFSEHNIQRENILQHINSSGVDATFEPFLVHKLPRHIYETSQNFALRSTDIHTISRHHVKRNAKINAVEGKENAKDLYARNNNASETENTTIFTNFSLYANVSQNFSEYFANNSSQEDITVTQLMVTTLTPTIDPTSSTKLKPKKPPYADGNQLKHDDKWSRTSLKQKTQNKNTKEDKADATKIPVTSTDTNFSGSRISSSTNATYEVNLKNITNKSQLATDINQYEDHRNGTDESEFHISDSDIGGKSNFSTSSTDFIFPNVTSTLLSLATTQNNITTAKPSTTQKDNSSLENELTSVTMPNHISKNSNISESLHSGDPKETAKSTLSVKITNSTNHTTGNDFQVQTLGSTNFVSSSVEIVNKTEFKQTSLRSAETKELASTILPPQTELNNTKNVDIIGTQVSEISSDLLSKSHEVTAQTNLVENTSQASLLDNKETRVSIFSTDITSEEVKPRGKHTHMDFLSNLFATMCQHRLGKFEIAYVILGIYIFIVASIFLICLCLNPREPRSRQEEQLDKSRNITATFKISVVILVSLFLCLYVGMEVAVGQLLQTFTLKQYLQLPESTGYFMTYSFWGSFALARGISIALSIKFSGLCLLFVDLIVCLTTSVLLVIGANKVEALLWVGIILLAFGMAPIFPAVIAWIEHYLPITNRIASAFILGAALGEMTIPLIIQRFINQEPMVLMYVNVIVNILCLVTFIALWFLSSHQGEKYKIKIDRTMYQLANFDDVEDGYELCFANSRWQNDYNSHILLERKLVGKTA